MVEKIDSKEFDILSMDIPSNAKDILSSCPRYSVMRNIDELIESSHKDNVNGFQEIAYDVPGKGRILEAYVCRVHNGIAANYTDPYMRRRDPDCVIIGDDLPSDKPRFFERFGYSFDQVRQETFEWLKNKSLLSSFLLLGVSEKLEWMQW